MKKSELRQIIKEEIIKELNEFNWPQSKLSPIFVNHLKTELDSKFRGYDIYGKGYDIYVDGIKIMTVNPDKDSVNTIVQKIKQTLGK